MIWTDVIEEFPKNGYIHPLYEGKGHDGRSYRPTWHAIRGYENIDRSIFTDGGEEVYRCEGCGETLDELLWSDEDDPDSVICGHCGGEAPKVVG